MKDNAKCFIKNKNGKYEMINYKELEERRRKYKSYSEKYFFPLQNSLLEVTKDEYHEFYAEVERNKYLRKLDKKYGLTSLNEIEECIKKDGTRVEEIIADKKVDIEADLIEKNEVERLKEALLKLNEEEKEIIKELFFNKKTIRQYAKVLDIPFTTLDSRKKKILEKLRKYLND